VILSQIYSGTSAPSFVRMRYDLRILTKLGADVPKYICERIT